MPQEDYAPQPSPTPVAPAPVVVTPPLPADPPTVPALPSVVRADDPGAIYTTPAEAVEYNRDKEEGYSFRRMIFVFFAVGFLLISNTAFVGFSYTGELVTEYVKASFSLMGAITLYYLCAGVLDRSQVLRRFGDGFMRRREEGGPPGEDGRP